MSHVLPAVDGIHGVSEHFYTVSFLSFISNLFLPMLVIEILL